MRRLREVLAAWSSTCVDIASLCAQLGISRPTVESYMAALSALSLLERVRPWQSSDYDRVGKQDKGNTELAVGVELAQQSGQVYYWRERNHEVDFVYEYRKRLYAIEVKSERKDSLKKRKKQTRKSRVTEVTQPLKPPLPLQHLQHHVVAR